MLPVARVAVDVPLPHLDRPFDYLLTEDQARNAVPGCRVRVRFSGQLVDGFVLGRLSRSDHEGRLSFVERVVSAEPVLSDEIAGLARAVADRWAGSFADVVRLAVPPRHAATEAQASPGVAAGAVASVADRGLERYDAGDAVLRELIDGKAPRRSWQLLPGNWPDEIATVAAATLESGRGVVVIAPDHRDVDRISKAMSVALGADDQHEVLIADAGPAERYRRFLAVSRGQVRCVVGTRAAVWAPVRDLGLLVVYDDGDDTLAEQRAPYCHARDVAVLRAHRSGAALLLAGHAVSVEAQALVATEWLSVLEPSATARQRDAATVRAVGEDDDLERDPTARAARLPTSAWKTAREALSAGCPVLVQVPRAGYQPNLACETCRAAARCASCAGPLARFGPVDAARCRWCNSPAAAWRCPSCGGTRLRAAVVGSHRTAEELGRAFPGVAVRVSGAGQVIAAVPARPELVVATPGAEPVAAGGYGAVLLLDGWAMLTRPDLRAGEETVRRWLAAAALARGSADGGKIVVVAPGELREVQALMRWQPRWYADRELAERTALHLPPGARMAALTGPTHAVTEFVAALDLAASGMEVLGPVPAGDTDEGVAQARMLVRVPKREGLHLAQALKTQASIRSARKVAENVRIELDPVAVG